MKYSTHSKIVLIVSSIITLMSLFTIVNLVIENNTDYKMLIVLPIVYIFMYFSTIINILNKEHCCYVSLAVAATYGLRCVIYPFLFSLCKSGYVGARYLPVSSGDINFSIVLIAFETIIGLTVVYFLDNKLTTTSKTNDSLHLVGAKLVYYVFLIIALLLYLYIGRKNQVINFIRYSESTGYQVVESTLLKLVRQITVVAIALVFCLICNFCKKKYDISGKEIYVNLAVLTAMINTCVIVGNRRSTQLMVMLLSIIILNGMFPEKKFKIVASIVGTGTVVILFITMYRWGTTSGYDLSVMGKKMGTVEQITTMLQVSYGGPDSVANGIEFGRNTNITPLNLLYDLGRSTFGLSFIFSKFGIATSNLYNLYIYSGKYETGQLLFSTSYGYITLGVFYPLITVLNILLSYFMEQWFRRTNSIEIKYMSGYCLMRIMLGSVQALPSVLTIATMQIGTMGLVIFVAQHIRIRQNNKTVQNI